jgi:4-hydroxy-tetrahydrodipicolinate synthase
MTTDGSRFRGIFANLPTALTDDGRSIDVGRMRDNVAWLVEQGVHGVSCLLTTGGFTYLTTEERNAVARCVVEAVGGRVPVLAGVTDDTTAGTIALATAAGDVGVDAVLVQPRSYVPLKPDEILGHYQTVAQAVDVPIGVYSHPPSTGVQIPPALHAAIVERTGAVVAKDSAAGLENVYEILRRCGRSYGYLWPEYPLLVPALVLGAPGCCTNMAALFPREVLAIYEAVVENRDHAAGQRAVDRLEGIRRAMRTIGGIRAVKAVAALRGHSFGGHRRPLTSAPPESMASLREAISAAGID